MINWSEEVKKYQSLGLWHATRYLAMFTQIKQPSIMAQDVVQEAWLSLWKKKKFTKAYFITAVLGYASNAVRDSREIELNWKRGSGLKKTQERLTDTFPVQIFGGLLCEQTLEEDINLPGCGDE